MSHAAPVARLVRAGTLIVVAGTVLVVVLVAGHGGSGRPPAAGPPIARDDFSDARSGWPAVNSGATAGYVDDAYDMELAGLSRMVVFDEAPELAALADARLDIDATKVGGPDQSAFVGLICRGTRSDGEYVFQLAPTGSYRIARFDSRSATVTRLAGGDTKAVRAGGSANHLAAVCTGGRGGTSVKLKFIVNGRLIVSIADASADRKATGAPGLAIEGRRGLQVRFDNLVITPA